MSHTAKRTLNQRKNATIVIVCGECSRSTVHEILTDVRSDDESYRGDIQESESYLIVQCRGCLTLSFCKESQSSEDWDPEDENALLVRRLLFPGRIAGRPPLRDAYHLPWDLQKIYAEARSALMQGLPVLTGIGIRAIVETVCNERGAMGANLFQKINSLVTLNLITQQEATVLHDLRFMGNEAAHKVKAHRSDELNLAFDVVEHLLNTVYLLAEQTKRLPKQSGAETGDEDEG
jgi:Domain of unknown function (DUF4145)